MVVPTWALKLECSRLSASMVNVELRRGNCVTDLNLRLSSDSLCSGG